MSTFNDQRQDESDELSAMLNDLPRVDPPAELTGSVMSAVRHHARPHVTRVNYMRKGRTMAKKVLWGVAGVAAVALVVMRVAGFPPVEKGTEATVGAAQRYQAPQVTAADVKTQDAEFQAFLQSDLFRQLAADKQAQEALKNQDLQRALADASVRAALARSDIRLAIANIRSDALVSVRNDASNNAIYHARSDARIDAATEAAINAVLQANPALVAALSNAAVAQAIANSSLATALARSDAALALSQQAVLSALANAASNVRNDAASNAAANAVSH